jgi:hypothetical protein
LNFGTLDVTPSASVGVLLCSTTAFFFGKQFH